MLKSNHRNSSCPNSKAEDGFVDTAVSCERLVAVGRRWSLRFGKTGYERLIDYLHFGYVVGMESRVMRPYRLLKFVSRKTGNQVYTTISAGLELRGVWESTRNSAKGLHFLYGDYDYSYSWIVRKLSKRRVSITLHNPEPVLRARIRRAGYFQNVDAIVLLGSNLLEYARTEAPQAMVQVIPHGVDTDFFCPGEGQEWTREKTSIIIVGAHLRDWRSIREFLVKLRRAAPEVVVNTVLPDSCLGQLDGLGVQNHHRISDEKLRILYREAAFQLYVPEDCVASNGVLEAMSCGTPVLGLKRGAVAEYVGTEGGVLVEDRHIDDLVDAGMWMIRDSAVRARFGTAARRQAELFDWKIIAKRVAQFLHAVHA